ncbi:MAG: hypothetical protein H7296_15305 [Bacteroidia bacterium]|nr:hypothetical protein [Bacteroidia bacterium]
MKIKDNTLIGLAIGLFAPSIGILIFYYFNFKSEGFEDFLDLSIKQKLLSPLLSLCCVINLALFYLFIQYDQFLSARGVILSTFIYGFLIVLLKFFL